MIGHRKTMRRQEEMGQCMFIVFAVTHVDVVEGVTSFFNNNNTNMHFTRLFRTPMCTEHRRVTCGDEDDSFKVGSTPDSSLGPWVVDCLLKEGRAENQQKPKEICKRRLITRTGLLGYWIAVSLSPAGVVESRSAGASAARHIAWTSCWTTTSPSKPHGRDLFYISVVKGESGHCASCGPLERRCLPAASYEGKESEREIKDTGRYGPACTASCRTCETDRPEVLFGSSGWVRDNQYNGGSPLPCPPSSSILYRHYR
jgi:hypothetical protein